MFGLGMHELMIIGVIAVLLFGRKLPEVARSLGVSYREFRKGLNEFQSQINSDVYDPPSTSRPSRGTYRDDDEYADPATAPKFDPPASEPQDETSAGSESEDHATGDVAEASSQRDDQSL